MAYCCSCLDVSSSYTTENVIRAFETVPVLSPFFKIITVLKVIILPEVTLCFVHLKAKRKELKKHVEW